jgi:hypothetical protein
MINPLNSPWNKSKSLFIGDKMLWSRWVSIKKYLTTTPTIIERYGYLEINHICFIAKNSSKMRLKSHLDWCHYTPKTLAQAIDGNNIESYYEIMLNDVQSDPNVWKDTDFEMELKTHYAARSGRASLL